jgi:DNA-binding NtrC family response regulator
VSAGAPRVLVVDDEPGIRRVLALMLRKEGCAVATAGGRQELAAALGEGGVDLLVTDMRMPDITGLEVLRLVQEASPGVRMLVMTAYPSADATIQAIQRGAVDYITKEGDYLDKRSEERRVGKECRRLCRSRWSPYH